MGKAKKDCILQMLVKRKKKSPVWVCAENSQQSHDPWSANIGHISAQQTIDLSPLGVSTILHGGTTYQSSKMPGIELKNIELNFDSPETLWKRPQQGGQWWRTSTERHRLLERELQCNFDAKDHSVGRKRETLTSAMAYSPLKNAKEIKYSSR